MPPAGMRIPLRVIVPNGALEAEALRPTGTTARWTVDDMSAFGAEWSGTKQLNVHLEKQGDGFSLSMPVEEEVYDVGIFFTRGPSYGSVTVMQNGQKATDIDAYSKEVVPGGKVVLKGVKASGGQVTLTFIAGGKHSKSTGYDVGLDAFSLQPQRTFIPAWYLIGPFGQSARRQAQTPRHRHRVRTGERDQPLCDLQRGRRSTRALDAYPGTPPRGRMDLYQFDPYEMVLFTP